MSKLKALEGLRGLAACMVLYCHFLYLLVDGFENKISGALGAAAPWALFFSDGELAVYIFWTMSAFVISRSLWQKNPEYIFRISFLKRYLRLALPILASIILVMLLWQLKLLYSVEVSELQGAAFNRGWLSGMYRFQPGWGEALYEGSVGSLIHYDKIHIYNSVLWSMEKEWWGSVGCFIYIIIRQKLPNAYILYPIAIFAALKFDQPWILCFAGGLFLSELQNEMERDQPSHLFSIATKINQYLFTGTFGICMLLGAVYLGGYKNFYGIMNPVIAQCIVSLALFHEGIKKFLSFGGSVWLGKISFSFYLIHMAVICSLSCFLMIRDFSPIVVIILSLMVIIFSSILFQKYIDAPAVRLSRKINTFAKDEN